MPKVTAARPPANVFFKMEAMFNSSQSENRSIMRYAEFGLVAILTQSREPAMNAAQQRRVHVEALMSSIGRRCDPSNKLLTKITDITADRSSGHCFCSRISALCSIDV